jgi:hypothetical protein
VRKGYTLVCTAELVDATDPVERDFEALARGFVTNGQMPCRVILYVPQEHRDFVVRVGSGWRGSLLKSIGVEGPVSAACVASMRFPPGLTVFQQCTYDSRYGIERVEPIVEVPDKNRETRN